jgi:hypothetical protein
MSEALLTSSPAREVPAAARDELARVVKARSAQGYEIETLTENRAVLVVKGRKRMFGMRAGNAQRTEVTINDAGRAVTRNI